MYGPSSAVQLYAVATNQRAYARSMTVRKLCSESNISWSKVCFFFFLEINTRDHFEEKFSQNPKNVCVNFSCDLSLKGGSDLFVNWLLTILYWSERAHQMVAWPCLHLPLPLLFHPLGSIPTNNRSSDLTFQKITAGRDTAGRPFCDLALSDMVCSKTGSQSVLN